MEKDVLLSYVERIERLQEEIKGLQSDVKEVYAEAESRGIDKDALKRIVKFRTKDPKEAEAEDCIFEEYKKLLGM